MAGLIAAIANTILGQRLVPQPWKETDVCTIPMISKYNRKDLSPISLTPVISTIVSDFVYSWVLEVVKLKLHWNQFGALKGSLTVDALVYLLCNMITAIDSIGTFV